jgi:hypothetical protein
MFGGIGIPDARADRKVPGLAIHCQIRFLKECPPQSILGLVSRSLKKEVPCRVPRNQWIRSLKVEVWKCDVGDVSSEGVFPIVKVTDRFPETNEACRCHSQDRDPLSRCMSTQMLIRKPGKPK